MTLADQARSMRAAVEATEVLLSLTTGRPWPERVPRQTRVAEDGLPEPPLAVVNPPLPDFAAACRIIKWSIGRGRDGDVVHGFTGPIGDTGVVMVWTAAGRYDDRFVYAFPSAHAAAAWMDFVNGVHLGGPTIWRNVEIDAPDEPLPASVMPVARDAILDMLPRSDGWIHCEPGEYKALTTGWWADERIRDALWTTS